VNVDAEQDVLDVLEWINAMQVARRDQRVESGKVLAGLRASDE